MVPRYYLVAIIFLSLCCFCPAENLVSGKDEIEYKKLDYDIYIRNALPAEDSFLTLHCFSADDDLGWHNLTIDGQEFHWHFIMNFFMSTKYYCNFVWSTKSRGFCLFEQRIAKEYCGPFFRKKSVCFWKIQADGFYVGSLYDAPPWAMHKVNWWVDNPPPIGLDA